MKWSLANQRGRHSNDKMCGMISYIVAGCLEKRFALKAGKCVQHEGCLRCLGLHQCLATECRVAVLCKCLNVCVAGTGGERYNSCII